MTMAKIALIKNKSVQSIMIAGDDWQSIFPDGVLADDTVAVGDLYNGKVFSRAQSTTIADDLQAYASGKRYDVETGGSTVFGFIVKTGREDRTLIYEAEASAKADSSFTTTWVAKDGTPHDIGAEMVITMAAAVRSHVASCFSTYTAVAAGIAAGTITTTEQIDAAAWPTNG